ncbi:MAG: hypothetical protein ABIK36_08100 [Pseudomonadota bacterium]
MRRYVLPVLSFYLDYILVSMIVALAAFFLGEAWSLFAGEDTRWYAEFDTSLALVTLGRVLGLSAGDRLLAAARDLADEELRPRLWPNLALGTLLILDGLKQMVRWSQLDAVIPVFGMVETTPVKAALLVAMGALYVAAGAMILRFARNAKAAAITTLAVSAASLGLSWSVLPDERLSWRGGNQLGSVHQRPKQG